MAENFLEMRCPKCGNDDRLDIQARHWIRVCDDDFDDDVPNCGGHERMGQARCASGLRRLRCADGGGREWIRTMNIRSINAT